MTTSFCIGQHNNIHVICMQNRSTRTSGQNSTLGNTSKVAQFRGETRDLATLATLLCVREKLTQKTSTISWQQRGRVLNAIQKKNRLVTSPILTRNPATTIHDFNTLV